MNGWFLALIILATLSVGISLSKHGQRRTDEKHNFWASLIGAGIQLFLTYMAITTGF